jgi:diaminopimelate epimerase
MADPSSGLSFVKMTGAGNDFILVDDRAGLLGPAERAALARRLCPRRLAVGADGLVLLDEAAEADLHMRLFNADGSEAEMCGNAVRCLALYAAGAGLAPPRMRIATVAGIIHAEVLGPERARVQLTDAGRPRRLAGIDFGGPTAEVYSVNTGVPHAVVFVADLEAADVVGWGRALRHHEAFSPAGTNVDFVAAGGEGVVCVRTYERGVEDETLACGTGVTAAALAAAEVGPVEMPLRVRTRSGAELEVSFRRDDDRVSGIYLEGPGAVVYHGRLP